MKHLFATLAFATLALGGTSAFANEAEAASELSPELLGAVGVDVDVPAGAAFVDALRRRRAGARDPVLSPDN